MWSIGLLNQHGIMVPFRYQYFTFLFLDLHFWVYWSTDKLSRIFFITTYKIHFILKTNFFSFGRFLFRFSYIKDFNLNYYLTWLRWFLISQGAPFRGTLFKWREAHCLRNHKGVFCVESFLWVNSDWPIELLYQLLSNK